MQNVPKIVRERLRTAAPTVGHLDANVLTAFAERSLPKTERTVVLEHLARCGDCRDVLALALPEPEAKQTVFVPARGGWLTWPTFRWAFVTAGVVAIAAIGVVQLQRRHALTETKQVARFEGPASPLSQNAAPSSAESTAESRKKSLPVTPSAGATSAGYAGFQMNEKQLIARAAPGRAATPSTFGGAVAGAAAGQLQRGLQMPAQWQQPAAGAKTVPLLALSAPPKQQADMATDRKIPAASEMIQVQVQAQQVQTEVQAQVQADQQSQLQAQAQPTTDQFDYQSKRVDKAKPPVSGQGAAVGGPVPVDANAQQVPAAANVAGLNGRNVTQLTELVSGRMPRWNIGSTGSLQRSLDQGKTWQDVEIRASIAPESSLTGFVIMPETPLAKADNADKKDSKQPAASVVFRAVSAFGFEVWAAGSNGVLYHSTDAGQHWTRVAPSFGGASLTGDIVSVEFSETQHGKITTSTGEVWVTSDNGQNWQRQ